MKKIIILAAVAATVSVPALARNAGIPGHPLPGRSMASTFVIQNWLDTELPGGSYVAELAKAYQERADYEAAYSGDGDTNWYDATAFYAKSVRAANGEDVQPWAPSELGLDDAVLTVAYDATIKRAAKYRSIAPAACAQLVALYDHYIEQVRETPHYITEPDAVFTGWVAAYKSCYTPSNIYGFPINACENTDNDRRIQDEPAPGLNERSKAEALAAELGADEASGLLGLIDAFIMVEGHASTTASMRYNKRLGECRAGFVKELLTVAGVETTRVGAVSKGEEELEVQTGDGVEEYRNRRVVVIEQ
ncbi:MAG: OmpA family protein [Pseudomonadota bacterium]